MKPLVILSAVIRADNRLLGDHVVLLATSQLPRHGLITSKHNFNKANILSIEAVPIFMHSRSVVLLMHTFSSGDEWFADVR